MHLMPKPFTLLHGDDVPLQAFVQEYHPCFLRVARTFVSSAVDAEDATQETWLGILRGMNRFEGRCSLKTWAFTILKNRARTHGIGEQQRSRFFHGLSPHHRCQGIVVNGEDASSRPKGRGKLPPIHFDERSPERLLLSKEVFAQIQTAIKNLPPVQRQVFVLHFLEELDSKEICKILNIRTNNQRVLLHRARVFVRRALERNYGN